MYYQTTNKFIADSSLIYMDMSCLIQVQSKRKHYELFIMLFTEYFLKTILYKRKPNLPFVIDTPG